jgi:hypothetical protein
MAWMMTESSTRKQAIYPVIGCEKALIGRASYSVLREPVLVCVPNRGKFPRIMSITEDL